MDTTLTFSQLITALMGLTMGGFSIWSFFSNRRHAESKEEKAARLAREKCRDDEMADMKAKVEHQKGQTELLVKFHAEATLRADAQLATFVDYAKQQTGLAIEVTKLLERDKTREKSLENIDKNIDKLTSMVTNLLITQAKDGNGK